MTGNQKNRFPDFQDCLTQYYFCLILRICLYLKKKNMRTTSLFYCCISFNETPNRKSKKLSPSLCKFR